MSNRETGGDSSSLLPVSRDSSSSCFCAKPPLPLPSQLAHSDVASSLPLKPPGKTNTQLLLCASPHPATLHLCAQACPELHISRLRIKTLPANEVPSQVFLLFSFLQLRAVCGDEQMSAQLGCSGHWRRTPELLPSAAGHSWQGQTVPCAMAEAAVPPHPALGRAGLGCESKSSLYFLLEGSRSYQLVVVSVSVWEGSGFGGKTAKGDFFLEKGSGKGVLR